jgi:hypothetical protein
MNELKEGRNCLDIKLGRKPSQMNMWVALYVNGDDDVQGSVTARVYGTCRRKESRRLEGLLAHAIFTLGGAIDDAYDDYDKFVVNFWLPFDKIQQFIEKYGSSRVEN